MRRTTGAALTVVVLCATACGASAGRAAAPSTPKASPKLMAAPSSGTAAESSTGFDPAFRALTPRDRLRHVVAVMHGRGVLLVTSKGTENDVTANGLDATDLDVRIDDCVLLDPCARGAALVLREMQLMGDAPKLVDGDRAVVFIGPENSGPSSFGGGDTSDRIAVHGTSVLAVRDGKVTYGGEVLTSDEVLALAAEHLPWPDPAG